MKQISKTVQTYYSVLSIITLSLIGSGFYLFQNSDPIKSSANQTEIVTSISPTISLTSKDNFISGEEATINLEIEVKEAILGAKINLIYDPAYIEIKSSENDGALDKATVFDIDSSQGTVKMQFSPLSGVTRSGIVATFKVLPKQKGSSSITYSQTESTVISTLSGADIVPSLNLVDLIID